MLSKANKILCYHLIAMASWVGICFTISSPARKAKVLQRTVVLSKSPQYHAQRSKGHLIREVILNFYDPAGPYRIAGYEYTYLNHPQFLQQVKFGSKVDVSLSGDAITALAVHNHPLIDVQAVATAVATNKHINQTVGYIFLIWLAMPIILRLIAGDALFLKWTRYYIGLSFLVYVALFFIVTQWHGDPPYLEDSYTKFPIPSQPKQPLHIKHQSQTKPTHKTTCPLITLLSK